MSAQRLSGSCHCGAVRFTASIDLDLPTYRCNCSICARSRAWFAPVKAANFTLDADPDSISEYRFGAGRIAHCFCRTCGVKTHGRVKGETPADEQVAVMVACLDIAPAVRDGLQRTCLDGLAERWDRQPEFFAHL